MSTDAPFTPPKKKPNVLWWIGGAIALVVILFFLQLFGPNPPIVVSPQTTYITSPLGADGLPDYERHLLERQREGVTPDNNAAALLWKALWPGELDPSQYADVVTELGLETVPSPENALVGLYHTSNEQAIRTWLKQQGLLPADPATVAGVGEFAGLDEGAIEGHLVEKVLRQAGSRPWTSEQAPPLARWVAANKKPLDMLVEASQRPRCYFPSPSLLDRERESLVAMLLPGVQGVREAGRSLPARAMWHLGEDRPDEAWKDLLAVHRIGRLTAQGQTLVEQLVGIAIDGLAREGTLTLLDQGRLTVEQARQIQGDLASLPNFNGMADSLDSMERLSYVDLVTQIGARKNRDMMPMLGMAEERLNLVHALSVDWNVVLRKGNEFYDRLAAAARLPDRTARRQAYAQIDNDLQQLAEDVHNPASLAAGVISPGRRSELAAAMMLSLFLPAVHAATDAQDRANTQLELLRLAAALAVYRAQHGTYPNKLDELVPAVLPELPVDLYNAQKYLYKRTDDGYLLYSTGVNGVDDGGSNKMYRVLHGQSVDQFDSTKAETMETQIPNGADDFSVRLPTPKWEPPRPPAIGGEP